MFIRQKGEKETGEREGSMAEHAAVSWMQTSGDLAHLRDGGVVCGDAAQLLGVGRGRPRQPQHQRKQPLVPAEGLLGQLAAGQGGVQGQVKLWEKTSEHLCSSAESAEAYMRAMILFTHSIHLRAL